MQAQAAPTPSDLRPPQEALADGRLKPGGLVTEGTVGSTGVSLAMCAAAYGCRAFIAMPDDAAIEKAQMLQVGWVVPRAPTAAVGS